MVERKRSGSAFDQHLKEAAQEYVHYVGTQSRDSGLRESLLKSAVCMLARALEIEFEGHQDVLVATLRAQAYLIEAANA